MKPCSIKNQRRNVGRGIITSNSKRSTWRRRKAIGKSIRKPSRKKLVTLLFNNREAITTRVASRTRRKCIRQVIAVVEY
jgi:hypothetical protein